MTADEIVSALTRTSDRVPEEALRAADTQRTELTPTFLAALAEAVATPDRLKSDPDYELPFYAFYLLAAWRETQAFPLVLGFLRLPGDMPMELSGNIITEDMGRILAQTCGGDVSSLVSLAADRDVNEWARGAAIKALALLTTWGEQSRETLIAHFVRIIDDCRNRDARDADAVPIANVVCYSLDLQLVELRDQLIRLFEEERVEYGMVSIGELEDELGNRAPLMLDEPIQDVAADISWWGCFHRHKSQRIAKHPGKFAANQPVPLKAVESTQPFRATPKVGRNDPCPCGSGKKYKKCCGA